MTDIICYNDSPLGVPYAFENRVEQRGIRVGIVRRCAQCGDEFFTEVDADSKAVGIDGYALHFVTREEAS